jgi:two-component system, OmpR family, sensor kinase
LKKTRLNLKASFVAVADNWPVMLMKSLKAKMFVALSLLWMAGGLLGAGSTYWLERNQMNDLLDAHLKGAALWLSAGRVGAMGAHGAPGHSPDGFVGQVWRRGDERPSDSSDSDVLFDRHAVEGFSVQRVAGEPYQVYTLRQDGNELVYQVGQPIAYREETARHAALLSLWPRLVFIPLIWLSIMLVVNRALAPLARASSQAEHVGIDSFEPLDVSQLPDEVKSLAVSINRMLARLQVDVAIKKRFIADAAHELRTPIAALQLRADHLANASEGTARTKCKRDLDHSLARIAALISQLLDLARADAHVDTADRGWVDMRTLVQLVVEDFLPIADARSIDLGVRRFDKAKVYAIESELRMAVRNIVENALNYSPEGGRIDIDVLHTTTGVVVSVVDSGPGIPDHMLTRVFDRFYRNQVGWKEGSGLGLSIVRAVVEKYRGTISLENRNDAPTGLNATISLPELPAARGSGGSTSEALCPSNSGGSTAEDGRANSIG